MIERFREFCSVLEVAAGAARYCGGCSEIGIPALAVLSADDFVAKRNDAASLLEGFPVNACVCFVDRPMRPRANSQRLGPPTIASDLQRLHRGHDEKRVTAVGGPPFPLFVVVVLAVHAPALHSLPLLLPRLVDDFVAFQ